jgi:glutathione S-transferase
VKLYDSIGPNPRIVRMFMAEKGIDIPKQTVDLRGGENRQADHLKRNPHGQMPTLELDDGSYLSEITAICEYLEEKKPEPAMIGTTASGPCGLRLRCSACRFSPPRRSTVCLGISMPFSAMNIRTMRGFGPIES